ncbi:hypothetical protein U3516DRAFT_737244 [Neocallimastix sp. 'constans']
MIVFVCQICAFYVQKQGHFTAINICSHCCYQSSEMMTIIVLASKLYVEHLLIWASKYGHIVFVCHLTTHIANICKRCCKMTLFLNIKCTYLIKIHSYFKRVN